MTRDAQAKAVLILLLMVTAIAGAQSSKEDLKLAEETQTRGYWIDPSTGLMWAGKDNGRNVNWHDAMKYCRDLRLAGYSDWRVGTIDELEGIHDKNTEAPGLVGAGKHRGEPFTFHIKGGIFLTGRPWSSSHVIDNEGRPSGLAWYYDFWNGFRFKEDASRFSGRGAGHSKRALCVRPAQTQP